MNIAIKVTGYGTNIQVANALKAVADEIEKGTYDAALIEKGGIALEDAILLTQLNEGFDTDEQ